tara:strand:+ start:412 stop:972 length:561 start_codon:yes stop_codon:yes gene_type:complete
MSTVTKGVTIKTTTFHEIMAVSDGWGWARLLWEDATGRVNINSDYGDWSYCWTAIGTKTLAQFLNQLSSGYMGEKMLGVGLREHSDGKTVAYIRKAIIRDRKDGELTKEEAKEEWTNVKYYGDGDWDFRMWCGETSYEDPWGFACDDVNGQWVSFWDHIWVPLIKPALAEVNATDIETARSGKQGN